MSLEKLSLSLNQLSQLAEQIVSSVRFQDCILASSQSLGVDAFIECGPAKVLAGLVTN